MTLKERFDEILRIVNSRKNTVELYEYLVHNCGPTCPTIQIPSNQVQGCISKIYLDGKMKNGKLYFDVAGESKVVQGMGRLLCHLFSGQTPEEIINFQFSNLSQLNYTEWLTASRQNGFRQMFIRIKQIAGTHTPKL